MRKRIFLFGGAIFFLVFCLVISEKNLSAAEYKIGYVDMGKVFGEYSKTKESEKVLEDKGKVKEGERKKIIDEIRKLKDEQGLLSDKAKAEKQAVIDDKVKALQEFDRKTRDDLLKERNDKLGLILKDIEKVIADYSKEQGYDFILDSRMLLYTTEKMDLTGEILKRLNK